MISEVALCHHHSSFWRTITPTMDVFVRRINTGFYDREFTPMTSATVPTRRGFINEIAFVTFCRAVRGGIEIGSPVSRPYSVSRPEVIESCNTVRKRVREAERHDDGVDDPTDDEFRDVSEQVRRLSLVFLNTPLDRILPEPSFPGCGVLDSCQGDILVGDVLYEIKAGDRSFRSIDFRQLMTYAALNHLASKYVINGIGLFNPRVGIRAEMTLEELCEQVSGKDSASTLTEIAVALSSGEISR